ncbi:hypothetical protein NBRC10512_004732 [Rhodotorula toruloides]|uniref:RHTO0S03e00232g1_1 n=2 Tax=Rhodotorula toruloides TaxID=5286 RepID=A0A061AJT1_RHOTO|nr:uncharacterized protein RHTO_00047 [Rhodotorula toruloides NP11]EMS25619.1 hypothetical protein RHTO_00047 [Rhodotorula toruloides NP11]KAJ8296154.1 hypothetical protein OF846_001462 [Rhodotorula toruloides]CDR37842.1 RHTO0S03e00232g1_1 [Rhodotorula toruloides]
MSGPPDQCSVCESTSIQACSGCRTAVARFCDEKCQKTYFCRLARVTPNPPPFSFPPLTTEEAAFFLPRSTDLQVPYTRSWRTEETHSWIDLFVENGWWPHDGADAMSMCLAELQKPPLTCAIPEPGRSLALMELKGLYGVHHSMLATFAASPWTLAGGDCSSVIRQLYRYYRHKGEEPPDDLIARISPLLHQDVIFHTIAVDQWISPEMERLAARRMADWVEQFEEEEGFKECLRFLTQVCTRTASGVEQCVVS